MVFKQGATARKGAAKRLERRPPVKILIAVWGDDYIRRFELLGLGSVLSENNLPALAKDCDVEFVFLTKALEVERFETLPLVLQIRKYASVRYEAIDDLIVPGLYTVTLTLAFTRGMRIFGPDMTNMYFVYWNADFVIGDGSLTHVRRCIQEGRKVVLAGSVRVISEEVEPILRSAIGSDGVLRAPPRQLLEHLFRHPHLMQVAKTVNQDFCWAKYPNHLFWEVDEKTIVARFFQIFMFCLRPTRALSAIDGYCDYSFVPAFCPGEPIYVVGDSDEVCLLELQGRWQEASDVHFGPGRDEAWLNSLDEWCTPEHAEIARAPIVYHAGELPPTLPLVLEDSAEFVEACLRKIREPAPHPGHYYWIYGVAAWRLRRPPEAIAQGWPPELSLRLPVQTFKHPSFDHDRRARARSSVSASAGAAGWLRRRCLGEPPQITRFHPDAAALQPLIDQARGTRARLDENPQHKVLLVADLGHWIDRVLTIDHERIFRTEPLVASTWLLEPQPEVDEVVIYHRGGPAGGLEAILKNVAPALRAGGRLSVLCHYPVYEDVDPEWIGRDRLSFAVAPLEAKRVSHHFAGAGRLRYARSLARYAEAVERGGTISRIKASVRLAGEIAGAALQRRRSGRHAAWVFTARAYDPA